MLVIFWLGSEHQLVSGSFNIENFIYIGSSITYNGSILQPPTLILFFLGWNMPSVLRSCTSNLSFAAGFHAKVGGGGGGGGGTSQGYPHPKYKNASKTTIIAACCCSRLSFLLGFIDLYKDSTASKSTFGSGGPSIAIVTSFERWSLLRRRSLIYFMSLNEHSAVADHIWQNQGCGESCRNCHTFCHTFEELCYSLPK